MTELSTAHENSGFKRTLSKPGVFFLGFGSMIGFGWIVLTGGWIEDAGAGGAAVAFLIGGAIMLLVGLVYGELASAMPKSGGEHNYLLRAMGPRMALLGSWGIIGGYITVSMFQSVATPRAITYLLPQLQQLPLYEIGGTPVYLTWSLIGAAVSIFLTVLNIRGVKGSSLFQTSVVLFLILTAVMLIVAALFRGEAQNMEPVFTGGTAGIVAVLVIVPFLFVGFDVIPQSAEESKMPARSLGTLIVFCVAMAIVFYIGIVMATSLAAPTSEMAGFDLATGDALTYMMGHPVWGNILIAGGAAGVITTWNAFMVGASRLLYAMARSRMIPAWFGKMHEKNGTPVNAILFIGALTTISPFFGEAMLGWASDAGSPSIVLTYMMVAIAFVVLRKREPGLDRPYRVGGKHNWFGYAIGILAALSTLGMLVLYLPGLPAFMALESWIIFFAWWVLALVFFFRIPAGIKAGEDSEERLLAAFAERDKRR